MSVIKKFWKWLKGEQPQPKSNIKVKLRVLERRLERHETELRERRRKEVLKIRDALRAGNIELAKEHAKQAILLDRGLISAVRLKSLISSLRGYIERGEIMGDLTNMIKEVAGSIAQVALAVGDKDLLQSFSEIAKTSEKLSSAEEIFGETLGEIVEEENLSESAEKLLERIAEHEGIKIPKTKEIKVREDDIEPVSYTHLTLPTN